MREFSGRCISVLTGMQMFLCPCCPIWRTQKNTASMSLNYDLKYLGKNNIMLNCLLVIYHYCECSSSLKVLFLFCQIKKLNILILKNKRKSFTKAVENLKSMPGKCAFLLVRIFSFAGIFVSSLLYIEETQYNCLNFVVTFTSLSPK